MARFAALRMPWPTTATTATTTTTSGAVAVAAIWATALIVFGAAVWALLVFRRAPPAPPEHFSAAPAAAGLSQKGQLAACSAATGRAVAMCNTAGGASLSLNQLSAQVVDAKRVLAQDLNVQGRMFLRDPSMSLTPGASNDTDPYYIEKVVGKNQPSSLRVTLRDDPDESLQVWGGSAATGSGGAQQHRFDAAGRAWHAKSVCVGDQCLSSADVQKVRGATGAASKAQQTADQAAGAASKAQKTADQAVRDARGAQAAAQSAAQAQAQAASGGLRVNGKGVDRCLEMGGGVSGKETNAGKICYQGWSDTLDVVGASHADGSRHIKLWDVVHTSGNLRVGGPKNCIEMGTGAANKQVDAGKMCYGLFSDGLDIVGAGTTNGQPRNVKVWDNLSTHGDIQVGGTLRAKVIEADEIRTKQTTGATGGAASQDLQVASTKCIELGTGVAGKEMNAGKICYQAFTNAVDVVGAGTTAGQRVVRIHDVAHTNELRLGGKFALSGVGSTVDGQVFNDEWLRLAGIDNKNYHGGLAAGKLWTISGAVQRSDARSKRDVRDVRGDDVDRLMALRPVAFKLKSEAAGAKERYGFIAQEVEKQFPDKAIVQTGPDGMKGVKYDEVVPLLLARAQRQEKELCAGGVCLDADDLRRLKALLHARGPRSS